MVAAATPMQVMVVLAVVVLVQFRIMRSLLEQPTQVAVAVVQAAVQVMPVLTAVQV